MQKLIETLINQSESNYLDFKEEQYIFTKEQCEKNSRKLECLEDYKSEFIKDILAMANSDCKGDAYILIGVREKNGKKELVGLDYLYDDAKIQQLVNSKVGDELIFKYDIIKFQEVILGLYTIPRQKRPHYIKTNYGKLVGNVVYKRIGSTTKIISPDDIISMFNADTKLSPQDIQIDVNVNNSNELNNVFKLTYYDGVPQLAAISPYGGSGMFLSYDNNANYFQEIVKLNLIHKSSLILKITITNKSKYPLTNAKIMSKVSQQGHILENIGYFDKLPQRHVKNNFLLLESNLYWSSQNEYLCKYIDIIRPGEFIETAYSVHLPISDECVKLEIDLLASELAEVYTYRHDLKVTLVKEAYNLDQMINYANKHFS